MKAWAFKAIDKNELIYRGNNGYEGDPKSSYSYDNYVANHKQVREGDIALIYNRSYIIGVSKINNIKAYESLKEINKCPEPQCDAKKLRTRTNKHPEWRCSNGHEFTTPLKVSIPVKKYIAYYSDDFIEIKEPYLLLEKNIIRHNKQLSIQEVYLPWAQGFLDREPPSKFNEENKNISFNSEDLRMRLSRIIKMRRGQKSFRANLLNHSQNCAISGCKITEILEAAHVFPYRNETHNQISNGILLRSDIHGLFDLDFIAIHPTKKTIHLSTEIVNSEYSHLEGGKINTNHDISIEALRFRWDIFIQKNN